MHTRKKWLCWSI